MKGVRLEFKKDDDYLIVNIRWNHQPEILDKLTKSIKSIMRHGNWQDATSY